MAVYVDDGNYSYGRMRMCHMVADTEEELHAMADEIGLKRDWFQGDHYDVCRSKRVLAIKAGATPISQREAVTILRRRRR